jgi:hypothetical protein
MITRERFYALLNAIKAVRTAVDDDTAFSVKDLYPAWNPDGIEYAVDVRVLYDGELYKCLQAHTSQTAWNPADAPSLWVRIDDPAIEWPEWIQPVGSTDAYPQGAKVSHNGKHWISLIDGNVWEPTEAVPNLWSEQP